MGLAIHLQMSDTQRRDCPAQGAGLAVSAVSVDMCWLTVCATIRALVVVGSGHLRVFSSAPHDVVRGFARKLVSRTRGPRGLRCLL
jgi:hypothetical protein